MRDTFQVLGRALKPSPEPFVSRHLLLPGTRYGEQAGGLLHWACLLADNVSQWEPWSNLVVSRSYRAHVRSFLRATRVYIRTVDHCS